MTAIHVTGRHSGCFLVMMGGNRALTRCAASHQTRRPSGARQRRVEQNNHEQADARANRTAATLKRPLHVARGRISIVRHYSVARHSLQDKVKMAVGLPPPLYPGIDVFRGKPADPAAAEANFSTWSHLDLESSASQTRTMAHSYIRLDFGTDEEKAQQARHKLDGWRQAFRLDKKLQYKLDRPETGAVSASEPEPAASTAPPEKSKGKAAEKTKGKAASDKASPPAQKQSAAANAKVSLLVRLYFSSHAKLSEQRWLERIPSEEPFKSASPKVVHHGDAEFETTDKQFEALE